MGAPAGLRSVLALGLALVCAGSALGEEPRARRQGAPFLGLAALDPFDERDRDPGRLERFADLGAAYVRTSPVAWGSIEPAPPRAGPPRYDWKPLDDAVLVWQLTGFRPVLVLTPECSWAGQPREAAAWVRQVRGALPAADAEAALRTATGCTPPAPGSWAAWERFVRDVLERYDGDGQDDMPGLRAPVTHVQVLARLDPGAWLGSADDYLRLLHHVGQAAATAARTTRIVSAAVDAQATGYDPYPDRREWDFRIGQLAPPDATFARLEIARAFDQLRRLLAMPRLYSALAQVGSGHLADDVANLRFLRRALDEQGGIDTELWLVDNPTRKLGGARAAGVVAPREDEALLRRRWVPIALNPAHSKHAEALAWLRRGQAFDLVRSLCRARAAGADVVLFLAPWDELPKGFPGGAEAARQGFVTEASGAAPAAGLQPTPSWWAFGQLQRLLAAHRSAGETTIGAPGQAVVFRLETERARPWVTVLMLDSRLSWAGAPDTVLPARDVLVPLPSGRYVVEACRLGPEPPERKPIEVKDGMVRLTLTPAPVYVIPVEDDAR